MNDATTTPHVPSYETLRLEEIVRQRDALHRELRSLPIMGRVNAIHRELDALEAERARLVEKLAHAVERKLVT